MALAPVPAVMVAVALAAMIGLGGVVDGGPPGAPAVGDPADGGSTAPDGTDAGDTSAVDVVLGDPVAPVGVSTAPGVGLWLAGSVPRMPPGTGRGVAVAATGGVVTRAVGPVTVVVVTVLEIAGAGLRTT